MLVNGETLSPPLSHTEWETKVEGPGATVLASQHPAVWHAWCSVLGGSTLEPGFHESEKNAGR